MNAGRGRGQSGVTLIEVMVALFVTALVIVPLGAWMVSTASSESLLRGQSVETEGSLLLDAWLPRDVGSAVRGVAGSFTAGDCSAPGAGETTVLSLLSGGTTTQTIAAYVVSTDPATGRPRLIRRQCPAFTAASTSSTLVSNLVIPAAGWPAMVVCSGRPGAGSGDATACGQVQLTVTTSFARRTHVITAVAARRTGAAT